MTDVRTPSNRLKNHTGTVHYATNGKPACGPLGTHNSWLVPSVATVTCARCIAKFGEDTPGQVDPEVDYHSEAWLARKAERDARIAAREISVENRNLSAAWSLND